MVDVTGRTRRLCHCYWCIAPARELCKLAFEHVGLDYRDYVKHDDRFERPSEVDHLLGDAIEIKESWLETSVSFQDLISMMVESDLKIAEKQLKN